MVYAAHRYTEAMPNSPKSRTAVPSRALETLIHVLRGQKVMLDSDLAALYGAPTKVFNQAVRRNHVPTL
jgi:hypothetical protein